MISLYLVFLATLAFFAAGFIVLYVFVVGPASREIEEDMKNPWERFE